MKRASRAEWTTKRIERARRAAVRGQCSTCGAEVLRGDDDDRSAMVAEVDAEPVTPLVEVVALLSGLASYNVHWRGLGLIRRGEIYHRDEWQLRSANQSRPIHIEHHCERIS